mgnify:FL=1
MKGRALRRALATTDAHRINGDVPLIVDSTEWITPERAYDLLLKNKNNRPINWRVVEEYAAVMAAGLWQLTAQGLVLDPDGNILTGQKRLWAVIYSGVKGVHMRVSRGTPSAAANLLDRGAPQSARDLASRATGRRHSPTEASIARAILAATGTPATTDSTAKTIETHAPTIQSLLAATTRTRKTRAVLMVLAAMCLERAGRVGGLDEYVERLQAALSAHGGPDRCWGRAAAFGLAMERAREIVRADTAPSEVVK